MNDNVIDLAAERDRRQLQPEDIWCCGDCGCVTFYMRRDGEMQCAACKTFQVGFEDYGA